MIQATEAQPKKGFDFAEFEEKINVMMASIAVKDKAVFSRQLAMMFASGIALMKAIDILGQQSENAKLKSALKNIKADIETGIPLSVSMAKFPDVFDDLYCAMVESGEIGGGSRYGTQSSGGRPGKIGENGKRN